MAQIDSISYKNPDLLALLLKDQGIHEGLWMLMINFGMGAGNVGTDENSVFPTAMVQVAGVGLMRAPVPGPAVVDASVVNPVVKK